jgi:hypothetical protein
MKWNPTARGRERPRKIIDKSINKDLELNSLAIDMVH